MGHLTVFHPTDLSIEDFYMSYDIKLFIDTVKVRKRMSPVFSFRIFSVLSPLAVNPYISEHLLELVRTAHGHHSLEGQPVQVSVHWKLFFSDLEATLPFSYFCSSRGGYFNDMLSFLADLRSGEVSGIRVRLDRLQAS